MHEDGPSRKPRQTKTTVTCVMQRNSDADANASMRPWQGACPATGASVCSWRSVEGPGTQGAPPESVSQSRGVLTSMECQSRKKKLMAERRRPNQAERNRSAPSQAIRSLRDGGAHGWCDAPATRHRRQGSSQRNSSGLGVCRSSAGLGCMIRASSTACLGKPGVFEHERRCRALRGVGLQAAREDLDDGRATGQCEVGNPASPLHG